MTLTKLIHESFAFPKKRTQLSCHEATYESAKIALLLCQNSLNLTDLFEENKVVSFVPINIQSIKRMETFSKSIKGEKSSKSPLTSENINEGQQI